MIISMIAAMDSNFLIGANGKLPWGKLPADMKRFRKLTMGKPVVMGRKTFESIGKPLPGRINVILTTNQSYKAPQGCIVAHSIGEIMSTIWRQREMMIIGGESIYREFAPVTDRLYLTFLRTIFEDGDTYFPIRNFSEWKERREERVLIAGDGNASYDIFFKTFERKMRNEMP